VAKRGAKARSGAGTRERILEVAEELIARDGFEGFQLKEIAERLGIRSPSIFAHFKGRQEIADAVAREVLGQLAAIPPVWPEGDPPRVLRSWARNLVAYLVDHPTHFRILLRDVARRGLPTEFPEAAELSAAIDDAVAEVLRRGVRSGQFRRIRPEAFQAQLLGAVLVNLAWAGWDEDGGPIQRVPVSQLQREAEQLALALVRKEPRGA
jgi:AcrR family transcriptional regulator